MALRILSWLRRERRQPPAPVAYEPAVATPAAPPAPVGAAPVVAPPVAEPVTPVSAPVASPDESLRARLDREVAAEISRLEGGLGPADRRGDPGALLTDLRSGISATIRRPPLAAQQGLSACRDPNSSLDQILVTFEQDPALTQALLRHANSPFYATGGQVTSLQDAAQRIGITGLHGVLMGSVVEGLLCRPGGEYGVMVQQVWTHMVRTAPIARTVGRAVGLPPENCYTLGLLHDLGKLIVFDRLSAIRTSVRHTMRLSRPFIHEVLARLHGPLGGLAALEWNLDPESARAIAGHPRDTYRQYHDSWYGDIGFTLEESDGEVMSQVLAVAEWWDLTAIRHSPRDFEAFWARTGLSLPLDDCRAALQPD
ncbi:MAG: HDOD domain-containing protein [Gemmatimonadales bacterium]